MRSVLFTLLFVFSLPIYGMDLGLLKGMKVDKEQMRNMIDLFVQSGRITKEQGEKAKRELDAKSDKEMQDLTNQAIQRMQTGNVPKLEKKEAENQQAPEAKADPVVSEQDQTPNTDRSPAQDSIEPTSEKVESPTVSPEDIEKAKKDQQLQDALQFLNN